MNTFPHIVRTERGAELMVGGKPCLVVGGELRNSSASTVEFLDPIWPHLQSLNLNTVLVPVSWRQFEPTEGNYEQELVARIIGRAREHGLRLALLWLATWKNGVSGYAPGWVLQDSSRFPKMAANAISPFGPEICQVDARAFTAFMKLIRYCDPDGQTVIMVQVENEIGLLGDSRDRSPLAEQAFAAPVPQALTDSLAAHEPQLDDYVREAWVKNGRQKNRPWAEVFGGGLVTDEIFMAWHLASHVEAVARAGQAVHPLPMFVNAWTVSPSDPRPGFHPSGGPVSRVMDIWMAAAPSISIYGVDNYRALFREECASYARRGNPLFIPEAAGWWGGDNPESAPAKAFFSFGSGALGYSPFGIDNQMYRGHLLGAAYRVIRELESLILQLRGTNRIQGFYRTDGVSSEALTMDGYAVTVLYEQEQTAGQMFETGLQSGNAFGAFGMILQVAADEFILVGRGYLAQFASLDSARPHVINLGVEEGGFAGEKWTVSRVLNGDEVPDQGTGGVKLPPGAQPVIGEPELPILRVKFARGN